MKGGRRVRDIYIYVHTLCREYIMGRTNVLIWNVFLAYQKY